MIRVGIDARLIHLPGVGRYIKCLLGGLDKFVDKSIEIIAYIPSEIGANFQNIRICRLNIPTYSLLEQIYWPFLIRKDNLTCLHVPHYTFPIFARIPVIVTLHDAVYYHYKPKSILAFVYYRFMHRIAAYQSKYVITVSEFSKRELTTYLGIDPGKIVIIPNAIDPSFRRQPYETIAAIKDRYCLPESFVLYVGTNKPWKNLQTLLRAFARVVQEKGGCVLVIAGKRGRYEEDLQGIIQKLCLQENVILLGEIPEKDLPALYSAARLVVCPSFYEGFGLVPLEAMACGTPVIASNAASLPEVVNGATILIDPLDVEGWKEAIIRVWDDAALREELRYAGLQWSGKFTVERMAQQTMSIYRGLYNA